MSEKKDEEQFPEYQSWLDRNEERVKNMTLTEVAEAWKKDQEKLKVLMKTMDIIESGYAGILPSGQIVDRREHLTAIPCQENPLFNTPKPKQL